MVPSEADNPAVRNFSRGNVVSQFDDGLDICPRVVTYSESNLALRDAVRVTPGGRGEAVPAGGASSAPLPGGPGIMSAGIMTGVRGASLDVGRIVGGVTPAPWTVCPTKPGPERTKGPHTPWEEPWWNAGRRARPKRTGGASRLLRGAPAPVRCGTGYSATAGVPLSLYLPEASRKELLRNSSNGLPWIGWPPISGSGGRQTNIAV